MAPQAPRKRKTQGAPPVQEEKLTELEANLNQASVQEEEDKEKKKRRLLIILFFILIFLLILVLLTQFLLLWRLGNTTETEGTKYAQDASVFTLLFEGDESQDSDDEDKDSPSKKVDSGDEESDAKDDTAQDDEKTTTKKVTVIEAKTGKEWSELAEIGLFDGCDTLQPGSQGKYNFFIQNGVASAVSLHMQITDTTLSAQIPFEYRLKFNGAYVTGDSWLKPDELAAKVIVLDQDENAACTLEWRWAYESGDSEEEIALSDQLDTYLGSNGDYSHLVTIDIHAEATTN